ncbi:DgyrCDS2425 [Dimorphilus gyrociliatus]|uniref:DgyrCDS2425 n=1 Tax=Dimorphilus gyrociliatus TaxID=2664684 RepID=A0A7I8VD18_9ANNE|nr:DgyrCDS2425 [Dimorphilus gyrociliatus]
MEESYNSKIIDGEASESDEEEIEQESFSTLDSISPLQVSPSPQALTKVTLTPKYNSLLQRKLFEKNMKLRSDIVSYKCESFIKSADRIKNLNDQIKLTYVKLQETSQKMRLSLNDLLNTEDQIKECSDTNFGNFK